jgi:hypothetical protein
VSASPTTIPLDPLDAQIRGAKAIGKATNLPPATVWYKAKRGLLPIVFEGRGLVTTPRLLRDHYSKATVIEPAAYQPKNPRGPLSPEMKAKQQAGRKRKRSSPAHQAGR